MKWQSSLIAPVDMKAFPMPDRADRAGAGSGDGVTGRSSLIAPVDMKAFPMPVRPAALAPVPVPA